MRLYQSQGGYHYNSDTLFLYDFITQFSPKGRLLDVGSGCGILGMLLKRDFDISLSQIELQKDNVFLNRINAKTNGLESDVIQGDFKLYCSSSKYDYIVSNPPFYDGMLPMSTNVSKNLSRNDQGLVLQEFFRKSNSLVSNRGYILFCYRSDALSQIVLQAQTFKFNLEMVRYLYAKPKSNSKVAFYALRKNSKAKTIIAPPMVSHKSNGDFSDEAKEIFQKTGTYSIQCKID